METSTLSFDNLQIALDSFINDFIQTYKSLLIRDGKKATGNLIKSIRPLDIKYSNNQMTLSISLASYWKYVENGRKPGIPRPMNGLKPPTEPQLAFLIARKIARDGIKPGNQFEEALKLSWTKWEQPISNAISKDLNQAIDVVAI